MKLGEEIQAKRKAAGMSRRALAEALDQKGLKVHMNTIYNWEKGVREPRYTHLLALRDVLDIRLNGQEAQDETSRHTPRGSTRGAARGPLAGGPGDK
jgi:transcriptional regulator with XRE-family HTH domain